MKFKTTEEQREMQYQFGHLNCLNQATKKDPNINLKQWVCIYRSAEGTGPSYRLYQEEVPHKLALCNLFIVWHNRPRKQTAQVTQISRVSVTVFSCHVRPVFSFQSRSVIARTSLLLRSSLHLFIWLDSPHFYTRIPLIRVVILNEVNKTEECSYCITWKSSPSPSASNSSGKY